MVRERDVEQYLIKALFKIGVTCVKFVPDQCPGMPDRLAVLPGGRVWWVELKTEGGRLSEIQKYRHEWLRREGHRVSVVWNKEQVDELTEEIKRTAE